MKNMIDIRVNAFVILFITSLHGASAGGGGGKSRGSSSGGGGGGGYMFIPDNDSSSNSGNGKMDIDPKRFMASKVTKRLCE